MPKNDHGTRVFVAFRKSPLGIIEREEEKDLNRMDRFNPTAPKKQEVGKVVRLNRVQANILRSLHKMKTDL